MKMANVNINKKKYALITGATGGIGMAIANSLLTDGYNLILVSRTKERLIMKKQLLLESFPNADICIESCNVADVASVDQLFNQLTNQARSQSVNIDVLINCAGISGGGITVNIETDVWINVINTNLNGAFFVIQAMLRRNLMPAGGRIINIASTGGKQGVIYGAPYCASKHGLVGLTKALGLELARNGSNITVNAVCPGFVETEMAERVREHYAKIWDVDLPDAKKRVEERIPIGRYVLPSEVAAMVSYLVSDGAASVTAQALNVCGGLGNY